MVLTDFTKIKRSRTVTTKLIDDQTFIFDDKSGNLYSLNESAGEIWNKTISATTIASLIQHIVQIFDVPRSTARRDTLNILRFLVKHDFIKTA